MTLYFFTPPTVQSLAWDQTSPLFRHYGTLPVGVTIYKNDTGWHMAPDGYDPAILEDASVWYLGGREYWLTEDEYLELVEGEMILLTGMYPGGYPGQFPTDGTEFNPTAPGDIAYPGADLFPSPDLFPSEGI